MDKKFYFFFSSGYSTEMKGLELMRQCKRLGVPEFSKVTIYGLKKNDFGFGVKVAEKVQGYICREDCTKTVDFSNQNSMSIPAKGIDLCKLEPGELVEKWNKVYPVSNNKSSPTMEMIGFEMDLSLERLIELYLINPNEAEKEWTEWPEDISIPVEKFNEIETSTIAKNLERRVKGDKEIYPDTIFWAEQEEDGSGFAYSLQGHEVLVCESWIKKIAIFGYGPKEPYLFSELNEKVQTKLKDAL